MSARRLAALVAVTFLAAAAAYGEPAPRRVRRQAPVTLVWHAELPDGGAVSSSGADEAINPASVVKVATSLWALERLGPEFRFETRVFARGTVDRQRGVLQGDLVVRGAGDPDFQYENAFLVAEALNRLGITRVAGNVLVGKRFWIGPEGGSEGTLEDPVQRGLKMAGRLRQALDPRRWTGTMRSSWRAFALRQGLDPARPPRVAVGGGVGVDGERRQGDLLLVHRSEPVKDLLRRFNCYSNNDLERLASALGPPEELAGLVAVRLGERGENVRFETTSGLGVNRLTPRQIVGLLREFVATCRRVGVEPEEVLPVAGCDPGTLERFFPVLSGGEAAGALLGKTGTLTTTDGGVSVLAGSVRTSSGDVFFCVAAPRSGGRLRAARRAEEQWVLDLMARQGGAVPRRCAGQLPTSDVAADVILVALPDATPPTVTAGRRSAAARPAGD